MAGARHASQAWARIYEAKLEASGGGATVSVYGDPVSFPFTDEQLKQWVEEAENGYDVDQLKKRGLGHPGHRTHPSRDGATRAMGEEVGNPSASSRSEETKGRGVHPPSTG